MSLRMLLILTVLRKINQQENSEDAWKRHCHSRFLTCWMKANYEFMALKRIQMYSFTLLIKKQFLSLYSVLSVSWDSVLPAQKPKLNTAYPSLDAKKIFSCEQEKHVWMHLSCKINRWNKQIPWETLKIVERESVF